MKKSAWHTLQIEEIYEHFNSKRMGLSDGEASERLLSEGKNELPHKKGPSLLQIMLKQMLDPLVLLLIVAMGFSFFIGEEIDGLAILFLIMMDLALGTLQEWKASKNALALRSLISVKCKVLREGVEKEIYSENLVRGDIVLLEPGNKISADLRVIDCQNVAIDESILTGESLGVSKREDMLPEDTDLADRENMVYAGTSVLTGRAACIVVATSSDTEIGKIAGSVANTKDTKTPLTIRMEKFSKQISLLVIIIAILIAALLYAKQMPGKEIFLLVIALSVSAMPEGLPLALTMSLTIASNRMAQKKVIVKRLNAVESLGSCTVIASDKTGTLTVNEQTAKKIMLPNGESYSIEGTGYSVLGKVVSDGGNSLPSASFLGAMGAINNEASLHEEGGKLKPIGDSVDIAFLVLARKLGTDLSTKKRIGMIPYESQNKYSAAFYKENEEVHATVKGSLEKVLSFCQTMKVGNSILPLDCTLIEKQNEKLASAGYRVIALAENQIEYKEEYQETDIHDLHFLGLVAFIDPVREEAKHSILECKTAGIKVVMITGDHPLTAYAIAEDLALTSDSKEVTTGTEVRQFIAQGNDAFDQFVASKKVFTRVEPIDKLHIVESYKRMGEFVAVTGDGVNDAPALKAANMGIAMGSGTDVAKETASMIVLDDNFKSIVAGIKEGRNAYNNIRKVSYLLLSCGVAEVLFFLFAIALNLPMPLIAIQLLWLNIITNGLQDFALSFEKAEEGIMEERPRNPKESIFNRSLIIETLLAGLTIGAIVCIVWFYLMKVQNMDVYLARGYIILLMVFLQNMHVLNCRSEKRSIFKISVRSNPFIIFSIIGALCLQMLVSYIPALSAFLHVTPVPLADMIQLFFFAFIIIFVMEVYKKIKYKKKQ